MKNSIIEKNKARYLGSYANGLRREYSYAREREDWKACQALNDALAEVELLEVEFLLMAARYKVGELGHG